MVYEVKKAELLAEILEEAERFSDHAPQSSITAFGVRIKQMVDDFGLTIVDRIILTKEVIDHLKSSGFENLVPQIQRY